MDALTITHTPEEGTLIDGTAKGDGSDAALKANGWRWSRTLGAWFVPRSRDTVPKLHVIDPTAAALREAGFTVEVEVDERQRPTAEVEADKIARQAQRVAALEVKAERKEAGAIAADQRADEAHRRLPPFGEPIKIGHHSARRHQRDADRAWDRLGKSVEAHREADTAAQRAESATHTTGARYSPTTVANRIAKIEAAIRGTDRALNGYTAQPGSPYAREVPPATGGYRDRLTAEREQQTDELTYWQGIRDEQIATGKATNYGPESVTKGDAVKIRGRWHRVARANNKSVSVETGYSWTERAPWAEVTDHKAAQSD